MTINKYKTIAGHKYSLYSLVNGPKHWKSEHKNQTITKKLILALKRSQKHQTSTYHDWFRTLRKVFIRHPPKSKLVQN